MARARREAEHLVDLSNRGARVLVVTHIDADGLSSGSIAFSALARKNFAVSVRAIPDLDPRAIEKLKADKFEFYLFTDLGSGLLGELSRAFGEGFLVVDHHQVPAGDSSHPRLINAWNFGYDGGVEACSSTMAYAFAKAVDERGNLDLSALALVGALGDRQDKGKGRSLGGLNKVALDDAVSKGLVSRLEGPPVLRQGDEAGPRGDRHELYPLHRRPLGGEGRRARRPLELRLQAQGGREVAHPRRALRTRRSRRSSR